MHEKLTVARPWLALLALCALFELPSLVMREPFRPTAEIISVLLVWLVSLRMPRALGAATRVVLLLTTLLMIVVRLDRVSFFTLMGEEPLLYDQLFMLRFLAVLISDVWTLKVGLGLLGIVLATLGIVWTVRRLLRAAAVLAQPGRFRTAAPAAIGIAIALWVVSVPPANALYVVRWMTPLLLENIEQSRAAYERVQQAIGESPYRRYDALRLSKPPDVYLVFVESYGRVLSTHEGLRQRHFEQLAKMQVTLGKAGWSMASGFSRAPVMGGRSWLCEGSVLMGTRVRYEGLFRQLVGQIDRVPNLVGFLAKQGYTTVQLAPADRVRPGVEAVNYYHYARQLAFDDLNYKGPRRGWGLVPDQYSLGYADQYVLRTIASPLYFEFHMVSSHAPWDQIPVLVPDWRTLSKGAGAPIAVDQENWVLQRLKRFDTGKHRFARLGELTDSMAKGYSDAIAYELALLERYLITLDRNALVILIGDHQPPFLSAETRNYDTPVHVLARDRKLLDEFVEHGFRYGLALAPEARRAARHEGLFSLIVRQLVRCCDRTDLVPPYQWDGAKIGEAPAVPATGAAATAPAPVPVAKTPPPK